MSTVRNHTFFELVDRRHEIDALAFTEKDSAHPHLLTISETGVQLHVPDSEIHRFVSNLNLLPCLRELFDTLEYDAQPGSPFAILRITPQGIVKAPGDYIYRVYAINLQTPRSDTTEYLVYDVELGMLTLFDDAALQNRIIGSGVAARKQWSILVDLLAKHCDLDHRHNLTYSLEGDLVAPLMFA